MGKTTRTTRANRGGRTAGRTARRSAPKEVSPLQGLLRKVAGYWDQGEVQQFGFGPAPEGDWVARPAAIVVDPATGNIRWPMSFLDNEGKKHSCSIFYYFIRPDGVDQIALNRLHTDMARLNWDPPEPGTPDDKVAETLEEFFTHFQDGYIRIRIRHKVDTQGKTDEHGNTKVHENIYVQRALTDEEIDDYEEQVASAA